MGRPWASVSCLEFLYWLCNLAVQKGKLCHPQDQFLHNQIQRTVSVFQSYWGTSNNTFSNSHLISAYSRNKISTFKQISRGGRRQENRNYSYVLDRNFVLR